LRHPADFAFVVGAGMNGVAFHEQFLLIFVPDSGIKPDARSLDVVKFRFNGNQVVVSCREEIMAGYLG
jgi:hypothetical protein